jgi:hypothetical protein
MLEGLLTDASLYLLFVPNGKRFSTTFAGIGDLTPPVSYVFPPGPDSSMTSDERSFLEATSRYSGGNAGFYRQVAASLQDQGDRNRPQFTSQTDYIAGLVMMIGTNVDPFGFLDDLWSMKGLFGNLLKSTTETKIPKPENLTAYALVKPGSDKKLQVLLKWDTMEVPVRTLPDLGNTVVIPRRRAIIGVRNSIRHSTANNMLELMGKRDINSLDNNGPNIWVINEQLFNPLENSFIVDNLRVEEGEMEAYEEGVPWTTSYGKVLGYWDLSNSARVFPFPTYPDSTPPDWVRVPSIADLFPSMAYFLRIVMGYIDAIGARLVAPSNLLSDYVAFLKKEIQRYESLVTAILTQIKAITDLLRLPTKTGGVYVRPFYGKGGNRFFLSDLFKSLTPSFPNAPPFHRGDEYVMGVVALLGGPDPIVRTNFELLKAIFSSGSSEIETLADTLGEAIVGLEEAAFGEEFTPSDTQLPLFSASLESLVLCNPPTPPTQVFGPDFKVVE